MRRVPVVAMVWVISGCGDPSAGEVSGFDAPLLEPQAPTGSCPYKVAATYDGYPIFSNTCLDNVPFYTSDGKTYDASGYYTGLRWQCVEWAERYFLFKWGVTGPNGQMPWGGIAGAKDMCEKTAQYYAERGLAKVSQPVTGDLMVFDTGQCGADPTWGHVGLVIGEGASTYKLAQQNAGDSSSIDDVPKTCAYCFIHALSNTGSSVPADPLATALLIDSDRVDGRQSSDVDGDGRADLCGRDAAGLRCALSSGEGFTPIDAPELSDASGWNDPSNYATLRMADFDGDGMADLCARANGGVACWPSTGDGFGEKYDGPALSDALGWNELPFYTSFRVGDLNADGRADLCVRASEGVRCWPSTGRGFGEIVVGPDLTDDSGWLGLDHNGTMQMADVDGDGRDDLCARAGAGIRCWLSDGAGFPTAIEGPAWSDEDGWNAPEHWSTVRVTDVNGDGRADVCGRGSEGFVCHLSTGSGFGEAIEGPPWSDAAGWDDDARASTIALADVDGDGDRDVCGRDAAGIRCHPWNGEGFGEAIVGPELSDDKGWSKQPYYRTIAFADIDGDDKADVCARAAAGMRCWRSEGGAFSSELSGPEWSDEAGWDAADHYATIRLAHPALGGDATSPEAPSSGSGSGTGSDAPTDGIAGEDHAAGCACHLVGPRRDRSLGWLLALALVALRRRFNRARE